MKAERSYSGVFTPSYPMSPTPTTYVRFADDVLSYNPFHCLPEHQPLGSINRVRLNAYASSTNYRHATNAQPKVEPTSIDQLPD